MYCQRVDLRQTNERITDRHGRIIREIPVGNFKRTYRQKIRKPRKFQNFRDAIEASQYGYRMYGRTREAREIEVSRSGAGKLEGVTR
jgi:hypothetical protein